MIKQLDVFSPGDPLSHEAPGAPQDFGYNTNVRLGPLTPLRQLQEICDRIYTSSSLKPYSKVIFVISRLLLLDRQTLSRNSVAQYVNAYKDIQQILDLHDDYNFSRLLEGLDKSDSSLLYSLVDTVIEFKSTGVELGEIFHALLQGKFSAGEGLGSFLTPTEIIGPSLDLLIALFDIDVYELAAKGFSDICAGTGRFLYTLLEKCNTEVTRTQILANSVLADHSTVFLDLAKINFYLSSGRAVHCIDVQDSMVDRRISLHSYHLLLTNPPFGAGKYTLQDSSSDVAKCLARAGLDICSPLDPALAFCVYNLLLLADGGVLGIVLPDGVLYASNFVEVLRRVEEHLSTTITPLLIIGLPSQAFSLAGTVAKTSFLFLQKAISSDQADSARPNPYGFLEASHVGFKKKGSQRVVDPKGNDIAIAAKAFQDNPDNHPSIRWFHDEWRQKVTLKSPDTPTSLDDRKLLVDIATPIRETLKAEACQSSETHLHISILDVNDIGFISFRDAIGNTPTTAGMRCRAGDVVISMLNPKIWRCALLPDLGCSYSCSPEFLILRPKDSSISHLLMAVSLLPEVRTQFLEHAKGTSSSRQRVNRSAISLISYNPDNITGPLLDLCETSDKLNCNSYLFLKKALSASLLSSA